jgi:hypothetical protein
MKSAALFLVLSAFVLTTTGALDADEDGGRSPEVADPDELETVVEAWWRLEDCLVELPAPGESPAPAAWAAASRCGRLARIVARLGDESDRERLWLLYDDSIQAPHLRDQILEALLDWHVAHAIERQEARRPESENGDRIASGGAEVPESLAGAPASLRRAWRLYDGVVRLALEDLSAVPEDRRLSFHQHRRAFKRTIGDLLRGRLPASQAAERLARFQWGGMCGCGSGILLEPRAGALVVAHLQNGRADLAARAAFVPYVDMGGIDEFLEGWERRLLVAAGLDWERFVLGAVLHGETGVAAELGRWGSEDAARLLLDALELPHPYLHDLPLGHSGEVLAALGAFVGSQGPCPGYSALRSDDVARAPEAPVVLPDLEERVLGALAERTGTKAGRQEADSASHVLLRLCRPETLEAFEQMRHSPFFEVRERGTIGLRALGEVVPDARPAPPVELRVILDGRPLSATSIEATLVFDTGGFQNRSATTTAEGVLSLERDLFLDPRAPVQAVVLSAGRSPEEARFSIPLTPPEDLSAPTTLRIQTGVLRLVIPEWVLDRRDEREELTLFMRRVDEDENPGFYYPHRWHVPVVESPATFPRLQHGTYTARLVFDGTVFESPEVTVSERPATAELEDVTPDYSYLELVGP